MRTASAGLKGMAALLSVGLSACQSYIPRSDDPVRQPGLAAAAGIDPGPSTQRLDEEGYPMLGAYPTAAAIQLTPETVAATRGEYSQVATARIAPPSNADYLRRVSEMQAVAVRQQQAAVAPAAPGPTSDEIRQDALRRQQEAAAPRTGGAGTPE